MIRKIKEFSTKNKKIILITLIHWFLTFFTDKIYFARNIFEAPSRSILIVQLILKFTFLVVIYIIWHYIFYFFKEKMYLKKQFKIFLVYFIIMMIFLLLTWPGIWRNDDLGILLYAKTYNFESWHHFLTSIYYIYSLMLIPIPSGVLIIQCLLISFIISYVIHGTIKILFNKVSNNRYILFSVILLIPFFSPAVIDNNLYPMRLIIYGYTELLLIFLIFKFYKRNEKIRFIELLFLLLICVLTITWRSESIYFIFIVPIFLIIYYIKKLISKRFLLIFIFSIIFFPLLINNFNNYLLLQNYSNGYKITLTDGVIKDLIFSVDENDKNDMENINKIIDTDIIKSDVSIWIGNAKKENFTETDIKNYFKSYSSLILKHLDVYFKNRINIFLQTTALIKDTNTTIWNSAMLFDYKKGEDRYYALELLQKSNGKLSYPINKKLRTTIIEVLEGRDAITGTTNIIFTLFWNVIPALIVLFVLSGYFLIKRKGFYLLLIGMVSIKPILVFLTAPDLYFMYYFPEYLIGYYLLSVLICSLIENNKNKLS